jgi:integrase/recombinase XerD
VHLTDFAKQVIKEYGNKDKAGYVFPSLTSEMSAVEQHRAIKVFTRYINQHVKNMAVTVGITSDISLPFARHSWATLAIRSGASMEMVI